MAFNSWKNRFFVSAVVIALVMVVANIWISRQFNDLGTVAPAPVSSEDQLTESAAASDPKPGVVKIDPDNDPLAPVVPVQPQPAPVQSRPTDAPQQPVHEGKMDNDILIQ